MASQIDTYEMTQYILESLAIEDPNETPWNQTFKDHNYAGSMIDLYAIVEHLLLKQNRIVPKPIIINGDKRIAKIPPAAWGCGWYNVGHDTSLGSDEINLFFECFHYLVSQHVISPGWVKCSENLPFFHVTQYGLKCIDKRDFLPYDSMGFLNKLQSYPQHDDWDVYYMEQCIKCFNAGVYDAATMILGIEGEYIATRLIEKYILFLRKNEPLEESKFTNNISGIHAISKKYEEYYNSLTCVSKLKNIQNIPKYTDLNILMLSLDNPASSVFMTYLRTSRNELAHPKKVKMDASNTMLMIVSFLKYFNIQSSFLDFFANNS